MKTYSPYNALYRYKTGTCSIKIMKTQNTETVS